MAAVSEEMNSESVFHNTLLIIGRKARDLLNLFHTRISEHQEDITNIERELSGHGSELIEHNEHENCNQITKVSCDATFDDVPGRHLAIRQERCKKRTVRYGTSDDLRILLLISLIVMLTVCQGVDGRKVQEGKALELRPNRSDAQASAWTFTPLNDTSVIKTLCRNGKENVAEKNTPCRGFTCSSDTLQISNFQRCHEGSYTFRGAASCDDPDCVFTENHILTIDDADIAETSNSSEEANSSLPFHKQNSTSRVLYNANGGGFITSVMVGCFLVPVTLVIAAISYKVKLRRNAKKNTEHVNSALIQKMSGNDTEAELQQNGLV